MSDEARRIRPVCAGTRALSVVLAALVAPSVAPSVATSADPPVDLLVNPLPRDSGRRVLP
jgi:hypothetical protein